MEDKDKDNEKWEKIYLIIVGLAITIACVIFIIIINGVIKMFE